MSGFTSKKSDSIQRLYEYIDFTVSSIGVDEKQSVKYYGAGTNPNEDDTPKIMKCVNANISQANGGIVYFPDGAYSINTPLIIPACANLKFYGTSATLLLATNSYVEFNSCSGLELSGIDIIPKNSSALIESALLITNCLNFSIEDLDIIGNFTGIQSVHSPFQFANGMLIRSSFGHIQSNIISNCHIMSCTNGIVCACEYTLMNDLNVFNCSHGIVIPSGNTGVKNSNITQNRIGIMVYGPNASYMVPNVASTYSNNPDHSMISGCTLNHNTCCGIFINSATSGYLLSSNVIIANGHGSTSLNSSNTGYFPYTMSEAHDTMGKLRGYGIYIQRCVKITVVANYMQQNYVNIGASSYKNSFITSNHFANSYAGIIDLNNDNIETPVGTIQPFLNEYNCITNNIFVDAPNSLIFGNSSPILFLGALTGPGGYNFEGNSGAGFRQNLKLTTNNTTNAVGFVSQPGTLNIASTATTTFLLNGCYTRYVIALNCTSTLNFGKSLDNTSFEIIMTATGSKIISATGLSIANSCVVLGSGVEVAESGTAPTITRTFTFSQPGLYKFINFSTDSASWIIQCP